MCPIYFLLIYVAKYLVSANAATPLDPANSLAPPYPPNLWENGLNESAVWDAGQHGREVPGYGQHERAKRDFDEHERAARDTVSASSRSCSVLVGIDEPVYLAYGSDMGRVVQMVTRHFNRVNRLFADQVFTGPWLGVYFKVARVYVVFNSCDGKEDCFYEEAGDFLDVFDRHESRSFCLSYIFTNRQFKKVVGMAWVGTMCRKKTNSGFVTGNFSAFEENTGPAVTTLAHELGHSLGAIHDEEIPCCGKGYIMSGGSKEFSSCSVESMHYKLKEITSSKANCLVQEGGRSKRSLPDVTERNVPGLDPEEGRTKTSLPDITGGRTKRSLPDVTEEDNVHGIETAICGNQVLEPGEECDCGYDMVHCREPCCYPAIISAGVRAGNSSARQCSRHAHQDCFTPAGLVYGVYVPWAFIGVSVLVLALVLTVDWYTGRRLYRHVTNPDGDVRINADKTPTSPTFTIT